MILVAILWGSTNSFLKRASQTPVPITYMPSSPLRTYIFYLSTPAYIIPLLLNLSGSVLYYYTLRNIDLSIGVPVSNSLTFVITVVSGVILGEPFGGFKMVCGMVLVVCGVSTCITG